MTVVSCAYSRTVLTLGKDFIQSIVNGFEDYVFCNFTSYVKHCVVLNCFWKYMSLLNLLAALVVLDQSSPSILLVIIDDFRFSS
jgi:hypothetical protein